MVGEGPTCPDGKFCDKLPSESEMCCNHTDVSGACSNFLGNGLCTNCEYSKAGSICEHNICRESDLARTSAVVNSYQDEPSNFDWSQYHPLPVNVVQVSPDGETFYWEMQWRPSSPEIKSYTVFAGNNFNQGNIERPPRCDVNGEPEMATYRFDSTPLLLNSNNKVGEVLHQFSLRSDWDELYETVRCGKWNELEVCGDGAASRVAPEYLPDVRPPPSTTPIPSNHTAIDTSLYR